MTTILYFALANVFESCSICPKTLEKVSRVEACALPRTLPVTMIPISTYDARGSYSHLEY